MKVAVLGYGTVGKGVHDLLQDAPGFEAGPVLEKDERPDLPFAVTDLEAILSDPTVDAVVEAIGGIEPAYSFAKKVLSCGKHFVTSNKMLVAAKGPELASLAEQNSATFLFSAACGGAIPYLSNLQTAVSSGEDITRLQGILNGTTNYILDRMQREDMDFDEALAAAKELGYAEADPSADLSGADSLRKIMLACAVTYNQLPVDGMDMEGITSFRKSDARKVAELGYVCRLKAKAKLVGDTLRAYVEPTLCPAGSLESAINLNGNMASYTGASCGMISLVGQGAGRYTTASAVLRDLEQIRRGKKSMIRSDCLRVTANNEDSMHRYYLRAPRGTVDDLFVTDCGSDDNTARGITDKISVAYMHAMAADLRNQGHDLFFAAVERAH